MSFFNLTSTFLKKKKCFFVVISQIMAQQRVNAPWRIIDQSPPPPPVPSLAPFFISNLLTTELSSDIALFDQSLRNAHH